MPERRRSRGRMEVHAPSLPPLWRVMGGGGEIHKRAIAKDFRNRIPNV